MITKILNGVGSLLDHAAVETEIFTDYAVGYTDYRRAEKPKRMAELALSRAEDAQERVDKLTSRAKVTIG